MIQENVLPKIKAGATVRVVERVKDGDKTRTSQFEGIVLARKHGREPGASFTVRTMIAGVGVEKVFPLHSPVIERVEIISSPRKVSRSKLYYLRGLSRKKIREKTAIAKEVTKSTLRQEPASQEQGESVVTSETAA